MKQTKIIAIANHKGGVGKTTTTASVGAILARRGYKVLVIDFDFQANLTTCLMKEPPTDPLFYRALTEKAEELPVISVSENLDLVPATEELAAAELEMVNRMMREFILKKLLEPLHGKYDFILIDCPPGLGIPVINAFVAATDIIVPLFPEKLSMKGLEMVIKNVDRVQSFNPQTHISGILIARWERSNHAENIEKGLRQSYGEYVFNTKIRKNIRIVDASAVCCNIVDYDPRSNSAQDYLAFTDELLKRMEI